jgi:hypothetical protein
MLNMWSVKRVPNPSFSWSGLGLRPHGHPRVVVVSAARRRFEQLQQFDLTFMYPGFRKQPAAGQRPVGGGQQDLTVKVPWGLAVVPRAATGGDLHRSVVAMGDVNLLERIEYPDGGAADRSPGGKHRRPKTEPAAQRVDGGAQIGVAHQAAGEPPSGFQRGKRSGDLGIGRHRLLKLSYSAGGQ